ncbi:hypothetical protein [Thermaerobacter litoralis]
MRWLAWTLAGLAAGPAALALYVRRQGDADVQVDARAVSVLAVERRPGRWQVRFRLPVVNRGRQKGMLYEILVRPEFPGRWAAPVRWSVAFFWPGVQETGYWSATLLKPGQVVPLEVELTAYGPDPVLDRLAALDRLGLVVRHGVIGRSPLRWSLTEVKLPLAAAAATRSSLAAPGETLVGWGAAAPAESGGPPPEPVEPAGRPAASTPVRPAGPGGTAGPGRPVLRVVGRPAAPHRQGRGGGADPAAVAGGRGGR